MEHARKFLLRGDRVKATVVFRGREIVHKEFGRRILTHFNEELDDIATKELDGKMEGRNMISMFVPDKAKIRDYLRRQEQEKKRRVQEEKQREASD